MLLSFLARLCSSMLALYSALEFPGAIILCLVNANWRNPHEHWFWARAKFHHHPDGHLSSTIKRHRTILLQSQAKFSCRDTVATYSCAIPCMSSRHSKWEWNQTESSHPRGANNECGADTFRNNVIPHFKWMIYTMMMKRLLQDVVSLASSPEWIQMAKLPFVKIGLRRHVCKKQKSANA